MNLLCLSVTNFYGGAAIAKSKSAVKVTTEMAEIVFLLLKNGVRRTHFDSKNVT